MQHCNWIYYSSVYWRQNMFRAAHRSSSGALNRICSLWFTYTWWPAVVKYCQTYKAAVLDWQYLTLYVVLCSWWWAEEPYETSTEIYTRQRFLDLFISINCSTRFMRFLRSSSGAHNCTYSVRYCQTNTSSRIGLTTRDAVYTVLCSWWWTEEPHKTCRAIYTDK
jgi:hypothetical protein